MRSDRRSQAICVAAARTCASCVPSSAPPRCSEREAEMSTMTHAALTRRALLQGSGALVIGFSLGDRGSAQGGAPIPTPSAGKPIALDQVDSFLALDAEGRATIF